MNEASTSSTQSGEISRPDPRLKRLHSVPLCLHCSTPWHPVWGAHGGGEARKEILPWLQRETKARDVEKEGRNRPGKVLREVDRSVVMGRGREPWDREQENSQREEGGWG